jgi:acetyl-CoA C-acetyltransferase
MAIRTPVLVGVGAVTQREEDPLAAKEPLMLMSAAIAAAGADAGARGLLPRVGRIYVPQGRWRYRDAAGALARMIQAADATTVHVKVGVLQQSMIADACERIAEGEINVALIVGGEAGDRLRRAAQAGIELEETTVSGASDVVMRPEEELFLEAEMSAGLGREAVGYYAIIESAFRARNGWPVDAHRDALAALYHRLSMVAAANPDAWRRTPISEESIRDASTTNRMLAFPYTRLHCSSWSVDQASALLLCDSSTAEEHGIRREKWVYPVASAESNFMVNLSARQRIDGCNGARAAGQAALEHAQLQVSAIDLVELYSCFPIAIETFAAELGLPPHRDFTVTGGMPFAGGPFNNFVLQATCRMALLLREGRGARGLVSSVSGVLTKQGIGLWAREPGPNPFRSFDVTARVANEHVAKSVVADFLGSGVIAGYTVLHERDPARAVAIVDVDERTRTVAYTEDTQVTRQLEVDEGCGRRVSIAGNVFSLLDR